VGVGERHFEQNVFGFQKLRTGANKRLEREENSMVTEGLPTPGLTQIPRLGNAESMGREVGGKGPCLGDSKQKPPAPIRVTHSSRAARGSSDRTTTVAL
jgi:hypothetical protein